MRIFALMLVFVAVGCSGGEKTSDSDRDDAVEDVDRDPTTDDTGSTGSNTDDTSTSDADGDDTGSTEPVDTGEPAVDNDGDGAATSGATPMDPATNNAAGMGDIMASVVNASALKITATTNGSGLVTLTQDIEGENGNTTIALSSYSNWNANTSATFPTKFTGGSTPEN